MSEQFYFYSYTDRRCIIQKQKTISPAYRLTFIGSLNPSSELRDLITDPYDKQKYFVTTLFGKDADKEKVESRQITSLFDAILWAEFVQSQHPKKTINIWRLESDLPDGDVV
ncbi:hypothetical protein BM526_19275 (plasmid) [Alteromonas mediterranea]|uniref:hypothetical protein n=1 Tax=Alteromonas mediterranea TaxID=314275 RepID=UPI000903F9C3|nr:hypothetical protein [Alteromonas mediterranea]APE04112.1 hypothetical protein BM526_19275 [Alteromonas mediterranea]